MVSFGDTSDPAVKPQSNLSDSGLGGDGSGGRSGLEGSPRIELNIDDDPQDDPLIAEWLVSQFTRIVALAGAGNAQLSIVLVGDARMAELHEEYLNVSGTTDVLTFDLRDDPAEPVEGEVVICVDEASRQAAVRGHELKMELLLYAVHGLLHLMGHDDHDAQGAAAMHRREDELLTQAGLGAVYEAHRVHGIDGAIDRAVMVSDDTGPSTSGGVSRARLSDGGEPETHKKTGTDKS